MGLNSVTMTPAEISYVVGLIVILDGEDKIPDYIHWENDPDRIELCWYLEDINESD